MVTLRVVPVRRFRVPFSVVHNEVRPFSIRILGLIAVAGRMLITVVVMALSLSRVSDKLQAHNTAAHTVCTAQHMPAVFIQ
jgi:hypothetical protein